VLTPFREILEERRAAGAAAGAFTCYNGETASGVLRAAETAGVPAVLLVSAGSLRAPGGRFLLPMLRAAAERAGVPACVQLDHVADLDLARAALEAGAEAIMADGSKLPYAENVAYVRAVAAEAARRGAGVEVELGHIEGGEDVAAATAAGALTDPDEAAAFVAETGADCLAVSIGNVHGAYAAPPDLDWERLARIRELVDLPLSLHGASGLPDGDVQRAVSLGIAKVNVNAEIRARLLVELERRLPEAQPGANLLDLGGALESAVAEVVAAKLELLGGGVAAKEDAA
jgi:tagatose 1,6-diphosphate aldolase GatY/KbaY